MIKNIQFLGGSLIGNNRLLFRINYFRSMYDKKILKKDSELCVEGFQRSGNSFMVLMLRKNNKGIKLAHHMHVASQVINATEREIPTVILIRKPEDALASLLTWDDRLSVGVAIKTYVDFYNKILSVKNKFLLVKFEDLILDYKKVFDSINNQFDTKLTYSNWDKNRIQEEMKKRKVLRKDDKSSPFPNELKDQQNSINKERVLKHAKFYKANQIYLEYTNG